MSPVHRISGIILAAGASERMGFPKANLRYADGSTLLARQVKTLSDAGIKDIYVVTGAHAPEIRRLNAVLKARWIENPRWQTGQFSSVQAGIGATISEGSEGALILPVDAANITSDVFSAMITTALANPHLDAIVPKHAEKRGHPVYVSAAFMKIIAGKNPDNFDSRLDTMLKNAKQKMILLVSDPNIASNLNTLKDWERLIAK